MDTTKLKQIIENILLVTTEPVSFNMLYNLFDKQIEMSILHSIIEGLRLEYNERSFNLIEIGGGFCFSSKEEFAPWIKKFLKIDKTVRLSPASLETLSIIAYKQPITRVEIEDIRGVDCSGIIKSLIEKRLIKIVGKKDVTGKPIMYGTSNIFLEYFGLKGLSDLPSIKDLKTEYTGLEPEIQHTLFQ